MKVTSKGQVTIPLDIRKKFGIDETTELEFLEEDGKVFIKKSKDTKGRLSKISSLRGVASTKLTTEQILALSR